MNNEENMMNFKTFITEDELENDNIIQEALIVLANNRDAQFGNVVIMAGGAGSGKGFVLDNLVQIRGKVLDVDKLKVMASSIKRISDKIKTELGGETLDLSNPKHTSITHAVISDQLNLPDKMQKALFSTIMTAPADRKPNLIFDVTLKDMRKLENISYEVQRLGYDKKRIHIIWVVNSIEMARKQNMDRTRRVSDAVLISTHSGVHITMKQILNMGDSLSSYMDGSIVISFNKRGADSTVIKGKTTGKDSKTGYAGKAGYVEKADYIYVKKQGSPQIPSEQLEKRVIDKIRDYATGASTPF